MVNAGRKQANRREIKQLRRQLNTWEDEGGNISPLERTGAKDYSQQ
jgi:hypothetical protein